MPFTPKSGKYNASIHTLTIGTGEKAITIGGEQVLPFYSFDAPIEHLPKVGIEITDLGISAEPECVQNYYEGCDSPSDMAKRAGDFEGVDFLSLNLLGGDPGGKDRSIEELLEIVKDVAEAASLPLVICGCGNVEKDALLLARAAEILEGRNALFLSAKEENYKTVGEAVGIAHGQIVGAESSVDINLAKQLNVLLSQLGVNPQLIAMNAGSAAAGYGFEYLVSTMERIKTAALSQNDTALQMPIISPVSIETWGVKETTASEADMPEWGPSEERGIDMEVETAAALLVSGSNAVILKHPKSAATISKFIRELS